MGTDCASRPGLRAVIFDFFGTVACRPEGVTSGYAAVFESHGYQMPPSVEARYIARYDGVEHVEHSTDRATYEAWVRGRQCQLAADCDVDPGDVERVVDSLRAMDNGPVVAYPEAVAVIEELRRRGFLVGVCSNWGWELETSLGEAGLLHLLDGAVTSAQAGARKPHARIFDAAAASVGVRLDEVLFVGDSLEPDVRGPLEVGMAAAHVWRPEDRAHENPPELPEAARRIGSLEALLAWASLQRLAPEPAGDAR